MTNDETIAALADASKGLLYPSESDEPFITFRWPAAGEETAPQAVSRVTGKAADVETTSVGKFFGDLAGSDEATQLESLHKSVNAMLAGAVIVRAGKIEVDVFMVCKRGVEWIGLQTKSVET
jgi:Nuclease A inhibitor-like protein